MTINKDSHPAKVSRYSKVVVCLSLLLLIILSTLNFIHYKTPNKKSVLGVESTNYEGIFWYQLLKEYPSYIPGWIQIGRYDKANSIDPNYL